MTRAHQVNRPRRRGTSLEDHRLGLGILVFLCAAALAIVAFRATSGPPLQSPYRIEVAVPREAPIVRKGHAVRIGGKLAGLITAVELNAANGGRTVTASITKSAFRPLPQDTHGYVRVASLLYRTYLELRPGTARATLRDGDRLGAPATFGVDLLKVVEMFDATTRRALQTTLTNTGIAVAGRGRRLNAALATLPTLSRNLATQLNAVTRRPHAIEQLIAGGARTFGALRGKGRSDVAALVGLADTVLVTVARRHDDVAAALRFLPRFEDELIRTAPVAQDALDRLTSGAPDLGRAARSLNPALPALARLLARGGTLRAEGRRITAAANPVLRTADPLVFALFPLVTAFGPIDASLRTIDRGVRPYAPEIALAGKRGADMFMNSKGGIAAGAPAVVATLSVVPRRCYDALPAPGEAEEQTCAR